jgi:hypothetical protein
MVTALVIQVVMVETLVVHTVIVVMKEIKVTVAVRVSLAVLVTVPGVEPPELTEQTQTGGQENVEAFCVEVIAMDTLLVLVVQVAVLVDHMETAVVLVSTVHLVLDLVAEKTLLDLLVMVTMLLLQMVQILEPILVWVPEVLAAAAVEQVETMVQTEVLAVTAADL